MPEGGGNEDPYPYDLTGIRVPEFMDERKHYENKNAEQEAQFYTQCNYILPGRVNDQHKMIDFLKNTIPDEDQIEIFGLNTIAGHKSSEEAANILMQRVYKH